MTGLWDTLPGRVVLSGIIGLAVSLALTGLADAVPEAPADRAPKQHVVEIPEGTAQRVAAGESAPSIPAGVRFVSGDSLLVRNGDIVGHEIGPMWVPAGGTGVLTLGQSSSGFLQCSFRPEGYFGLWVEPRFTTGARAFAIFATAVPFAALFAAFSIAIRPPRGLREIRQATVDRG
jgi:hypothetical protein